MADLPLDVSTLDDSTIAALQAACVSESSKRAALKSLPTQVVSCAHQFKQLGGNPAEIIAELTDWVNANES